MKTAISLPDDLFVLAEKFASERGCSRSHLYATALREYLTAHMRDNLLARINSVCDELDTALPSDLERAARKLLGAEEW